MTDSDETGPRGLGGLLRLPLAVMAGLTATGIAVVIRRPVVAATIASFSTGDWPLAGRRLSGLVFVFLVPLVTAGTVAYRTRIGRWLMLAYFVIWSGVCVVELALHPDRSGGGVPALVICLACAGYLAVSRRVKNTFVN